MTRKSLHVKKSMKTSNINDGVYMRTMQEQMNKSF